MRLISSNLHDSPPRLRAQATVDRVRCVLRRRNKFLLVQHHSRRRENYDKWRLPGGRLKDHEEPRAGLRRELIEELSFRVAYLVELGDWSHRDETQRVFGCEVTRTIKTFDTDEIRSIGWFTFDDVAELADDDLLHTGFELAAIEEFVRRFPS
jgi:8-oxo-dGTP diphosphatase